MTVEMYISGTCFQKHDPEDCDHTKPDGKWCDGYGGYYVQYREKTTQIYGTKACTYCEACGYGGLDRFIQWLRKNLPTATIEMIYEWDTSSNKDWTRQWKVKNWDGVVELIDLGPIEKSTDCET